MNYASTPLDLQFVCGVAVIDEQHRKLLVSLEILQSQIVGNANRSTLSMLLADFLKDLDVHFKTEEALIEIIDSEDARAHMAEHTSYLRQVEVAYGMLMMHHAVDWETLLPRLAAGLREHIGGRDVPLYREVRGRLQATEPIPQHRPTLQ